MPEMTELEKIKLEKEKLELEALRESVAKIRHEKESKQRKKETVERDLAVSRVELARRQQECNHRKGGLGADNYRTGNGNDGGNYAVNKQTLPDGTLYVLCLRCMKEWRPKDEGYSEAMKWPTDNVPAMSVTFNVPRSA